MRKNLFLLFTVLLNVVPVGIVKAAAVTDPVIVEITDTTLSSVFYHQHHFSVPTKLVFTNLTSVSGFVYFHQNTNLVEVDFPMLTQTDRYFYFNGNTNLETVNAPNLHSVGDYIYANQNPALTTFNVCGVTEILSADPSSPPYYYLSGNTPSVDSVPYCFSMGGPANLTLSNNSLEENLPTHTLVGTLSADSNYPNGTLTYYFTEDMSSDNHFFTITGNQLFSNSTFDFEAHSSYTISICVRNQLGEKIEQEFTINVQNVNSENLTVIEITDATLDQVYYHQHNFSGPTKLVFTNLTSVSGFVYFHQNINLVEVDFPMLTQSGRYFYFHGNTALETVNAPNLHSVGDYVYASQNTAMTTFNICGLSQILQTNQSSPPYYYIAGNTASVDTAPFCFSLGGPANLTLSSNTVAENQSIGTLVGNLSADTNPATALTYYLTEEYEADNYYFKIVGNQLLTNASFDFETHNSYTIKAGARNQIGEKTEAEFTISIQDVNVENLTVIEITDATLENVYYHQANFTGPTKLVFTNLTSVGGYVYFHQNINLVEVDFPMLTQTGRYFYCNGNPSMLVMNAPALDAIHSYLYVAGNPSLTDLNVCALTHILPGDASEEPYYYIENNPDLDFDSTCLENTTLGFAPEGNIVIMPPTETLVGHFTADTSDSLNYFFTDAAGNAVANNDFIIVDNRLYLAHEASFYSNGVFDVYVAGIRSTGGNRFSGSAMLNGLNEKMQLEISIDLPALLAVKQVQNMDSIVLFPNPAKNHFEINTKDPLQEVRIYDMSGRQLTGFTVDQNKVDVSGIPNGSYIVKANTGEKSFVRKLIVRK
jgi:uncharacterized protein YxeA